jgi:hypothetical protein
LGDIRQAGDEYAAQFLDAIAGYAKPVILELFDAPPPGFFAQIARALPNFTIEVSLESHADHVRRAFGRPYTTQAIERSMAEALEAGCRRLDVFFMVGLREQSYESVLETVAYSGELLRRYNTASDHRVIPFISPLAPFVDPGSRVFENPTEYGYRLYCRTLEEHRQALLAPSWKYVLNYETQWMNRDQIVAVTYEAGRRMNQLKAQYGVISSELAAATEKRINKAMALSVEIDRIMQLTDSTERQAQLRALKPQVDDANLSTVCDKRELEVPVQGARLDWIQAARIALQEWWKSRTPLPASAASSGIPPK